MRSLGKLIVRSHFRRARIAVAVHQSMSAGASLSQQLCVLRIFVQVTRVATQKTSIGRRRLMQNNGSLNTQLGLKDITWIIYGIHLATRYCISIRPTLCILMAAHASISAHPSYFEVINYKIINHLPRSVH